MWRYPLWALLLMSFFSSLVEAGNSTATAVALDANGNIVIAGMTDDPNDPITDGAVARLLPNGTPDLTFNPNGSQPGVIAINFLAASEALLPAQASVQSSGNASFNAVAIDSENRIVLAGFTTIGFNTAFIVVRLNTDGSLDQTFNAGSAFFPGGPGIAIIQISQFSNAAQGIAIDSKGNIVVVGTSYNGTYTEVAVLRLTNAGAYDLTLNPTGTKPGLAIIDVMGTNETGTAVTLDALDNIYVCGSIESAFSTTNATTVDFLVFKLLKSGTLDPTFNRFGLFPGVVMENLQSGQDTAFAIQLDAIGNVLIAGSTTSGESSQALANTGPVTDWAILRFTPAGLLDPTFNNIPMNGFGNGVVVTSITGYQDVLLGLAVDNNQNIVVTGYVNAGVNEIFTTARYTSQGILDTTFGPTQPIPGIVSINLAPSMQVGTTNDNTGTAVVIQPNNDIIATGFSNYYEQTNFTTPNYLTNGALNTTGFAVAGPYPGIAFTVFLPVENNLGHGTPTLLGGPTAIVNPDILEALRMPLLPVIPEIAHIGPIVTSDFQPQLSGLASPNAIITLFVQDVPFASTTATVEGAWTLVIPPLMEGTYTITALATDPISGLSLASLPVSLTISNQAPLPPIIESPHDGETIKKATISITGKAEPNSQVTVFSQAALLGSVAVSPKGFWSLQTARLEDGPLNLIAISTNVAGVSSLPSDVVTVTIDIGTSRAPRIDVPKNRLISNKKTQVVGGEGKPKSLVVVKLNDKIVAKVRVNAQGRWKTSVKNLKDGSYRLVATTADEKLSSDPVQFVIDTKPPKPAIVQKTQTDKGLLSGVAEPLSTITFYLDGKKAPLGRTMASATGAWSFTPSRRQQLAPGKHTITISVADRAGNVSSLVKQELEIPS